MTPDVHDAWNYRLSAAAAADDDHFTKRRGANTQSSLIPSPTPGRRCSRLSINIVLRTHHGAGVQRTGRITLPGARALARPGHSAARDPSEMDPRWNASSAS